MNSHLFYSLVAIIFYIPANAQTGKYVSDYSRYLELYCRSNSISSNSKCDTFNFFDTADLSRNSILLIGEDHRACSSPIMQSDIICMLHPLGYNRVVLEVGHGLGYLMNQYILKSDSLVLNEIKDCYYEMFGIKKNKRRLSEISYVQKKIDFLEILCDLNKNLDKEDKLIIYGVDYEDRSLYSAYLALEFIVNKVSDSTNIPFKECKDVIKNVVDTISKSPTNKYCLRENIPGKIISKLVRNNKSDFRKIIGEEYMEFIDIVKSINKSKIMLKMDKTGHPPLRRDNFMYKGINKIKNRNDSNKYIGVFGSFHVQQNSFLHRIFGSVGSKLNDKKFSKFNGKVLSVMPIIISSNSIFTSLPDKFSDYEYLMDDIDSNLFAKTTKSNSYSIIKINHKNSPFKKTSKNAQYLIIINDSNN